MSALDVGLVAVVALLAVIVVALVRAQAATGRRLDAVERRLLRAQRQKDAAPDPAPDPDPTPGPVPVDRSPEDDTMAEPSTALDDFMDDVVDLRGVGVGGEPSQVDLVGAPRPTLVAFLSTTCGICRTLWTTLADEGIDSVDAVVVTKDPAVEDGEVARELARRGTTPVLMSSEAWDDYEVPGSPYFLLVHEDRVVAEGEASSWEGVQALARSHA